MVANVKASHEPASITILLPSAQERNWVVVRNSWREGERLRLVLVSQIRDVTRDR